MASSWQTFGGRLCIALCALVLGGCSGIARGVTEAVLEHRKNEEDTRQCEIDGRSFAGIRQSLDIQEAIGPKVTKVMMVHGISHHLPGYSNRFQKKLFDALALTGADVTVKTIELDSKSIDWKADEPRTLGTLRISRHMDADNTRELVFYELTWSSITIGQKRQLEADSANMDGLARASMNNSLKGFINSTVPDLLIYNGNGYHKITSAVGQSVCWMLSNNWGDLPESGRHQCDGWRGSTFSSLARDDHFFVTHSLGSRIAIDTIQTFSSMDHRKGPDKTLAEIKATIRDKDFTVFMLANQLPLLQMGRDNPAVFGQEKDYCSPNGAKANDRAMKRMNIIAFSDPNDILSYPVPIDFTKTSIDSRICPFVTNVSLNVAREKNIFDAASFANPLTAHSGYMEDDRVIDLIANGTADRGRSVLSSDRCVWRKHMAPGKP